MNELRERLAAFGTSVLSDAEVVSLILGPCADPEQGRRVTEIYSHLLPDALAAARTAVNFSSPVSAAEAAAKKVWGTNEPVVREGVSNW